MSVIYFQFLDFFVDVLIFLGRNPDYQALNLTFAINLRKSGIIISLFPRFLKLCTVSYIPSPL